jgi:hypothetical protein
MLFPLIALFLPLKGLKKVRLPILVFMALNIYIVFSWWCWWYGGTYGQRSMIDSYALLAIPLAFGVQYVSGKKMILKGILVSISLFFIWLNIFQTYQYEYLTLHWEAMTAKLYFKQFGKLDKVNGYDNYLDYPRL